MKKIAIGSDHGGFGLKKQIIAHLEGKGYEVNDMGTYSEESCDYPDYAYKVGEEVASKAADLGILICGTGIGMSITANKIKGIRAALCGDVFSAKATREHNDANVLCIGERVTGPGLALLIVDNFIETEFSNDERHKRRIGKIHE